MSQAVLNDEKGGAPRRLPSYVSPRLRSQCYRLLAGLLHAGHALNEAAQYAVDLAERQKNSGMPSMDQVAIEDFLGVFLFRGELVDTKEETAAALRRVSLAEQILLRRLFEVSNSTSKDTISAQVVLLMRAAEILESEVLFASLDRPAPTTSFVGVMSSEPIAD